jgi:hypothetical protein
LSPNCDVSEPYRHAPLLPTIARCLCWRGPVGGGDTEERIVVRGASDIMIAPSVRDRVSFVRAISDGISEVEADVQMIPEATAGSVRTYTPTRHFRCNTSVGCNG